MELCDTKLPDSQHTRRSSSLGERRMSHVRCIRSDFAAKPKTGGQGGERIAFYFAGCAAPLQ